MPKLTEIAWAAGLFDGEASTCVVFSHDGRTCTLKISMAQNERDLLDRFQRAVGVGVVRGPYQEKGRKNPRYVFETNLYEQVNIILARLWPYLSEPKKKQANAAADSFTDFYADWNDRRYRASN